MVCILWSFGKNVMIWNQDLMFILYWVFFGVDEIYCGMMLLEGFFDVFDFVILIECLIVDWMGFEQWFMKLLFFDIDYYFGNSYYGVVQWIDIDVLLVGEMFF